MVARCRFRAGSRLRRICLVRIPTQRYVGGADVAAGGQGGQPAYVHAEQAGEELRLLLAELREVRGQVLEWAVALTDLRGLQGGPASGVGGQAHGADAGGEALLVQDPGQGGGPVLEVRGGADGLSVAVLDGGEAIPGHGADGVCPSDLVQPVEGLRGDLEVVVAEAGLTGAADHVPA
ncbi:hypothetical protein ACFFX0_04055 [Citricoccus parietis]|uniref:Uncharacterized protein n=1 Tax=Citricoccus parietis TaxID=592307 RepID=A0ABV5FUU9_9MICC